MRAAASILLVGGLAGLAWAGGMAASARSERVRPIPAVGGTLPVVAAPPSDAERRAGLKLRIQAMLDAGEGSRLSDRPVAAAAPARRAVGPGSRPASPSPAETERPEPPSTIAPPAYRGGVVPARAGRGYSAPKLDLTTPPVIPDNDLECLTQAIYYEARNESEQGQAAVAEVVLNRARHPAYPKSVCQVVYQRNSRTCQFTFTCDGSIGRRPVNMTAWARAERIAREVKDGTRPAALPANSVNYHADYVRPSWGARLARVRQIGAHVFYGAPLNGVTPGAGEAAEPPPGRGLMFVRNEALDRAYALLTSGASPSTEG